MSKKIFFTTVINLFLSATLTTGCGADFDHSSYDDDYLDDGFQEEHSQSLGTPNSVGVGTVQDLGSIEGTELEENNVPIDENERVNRNSTGAVGKNSVVISISDEHAWAGSNADKIYLYFGEGKRLGLIADFKKGKKYSWTLSNDLLSKLKIPQDDWDNLSLRTTSDDGMLLERVQIKHSDQLILDTNDLDGFYWFIDDPQGRWLDYPNQKKIDFVFLIAMSKLERIEGSSTRPVFWGLMELGKTNGCKYGNKYCDKNWCSEFASWCYRKSGYNTPSGNIRNGVSSLKDWFKNHGGLYSRWDILTEKYKPKNGDYMAVNGNSHSVIFVEWINREPNTCPTELTKFRVINGSNRKAVRLSTYKVGDVDAVGKYPGY